MEKHNDARDIARRANYVSRQQDRLLNGELDHLPSANAVWPTALVIVPVSVISNWQRELETWGYFEVGAYTGSKETRETVLKDFKLGRLDIVLSSFEQVRDHISDFEDLPWSCIFLDEAHKIKNMNASITKAYNRFTCSVRFGLTGTAVQNTYKELWPLLAWSNPGRLGSENQWKWAIARPLALGQSQSATEAERKRAIIVTKALKENLLPLFFLRRTKKLIEDQLPKKFDEVVFCPLTPLQLQVYKRFLDTEDVQLMLGKDGPCDCGSQKPRGKCCGTHNKDGTHWKELMLKYIGILIKISNHLMLLYPCKLPSGDNLEQRNRSREHLHVAFPDNSEMRKPSSRMRPGMCGKWSVLEKLLDQWKAKPGEQNKVLIFSKSVKVTTKMDTNYVNTEYGRDKICYLDGKTKSEDRMPIVDKFNQDPSVYCFLISTTAGGTGLNLTAANKVVVFDPHWNPAHDLQAMDRAYRYGQLRNVSVYRLLGAGSLEELVYARQIYKQQQMQIAYEGRAQTRYFQGVQGDKDRQGELFGLKNIFTLHPSAYATKYHIERALVSELEWALMNAPTGSKGDEDVRPFYFSGPVN
ncbi:P-loop containing nucleoside triphosphate hydrolase protein [Cantharellus anzutake]|uniref:P-loop containing nucleoside triphosphate hydrolase protein n=1 Tax=Cantharellus anzutake TaxID=1750568 RepID=UPI0019066363|nr:P-loop containing nucleoside triphosphate hydrolase protein [Cantharellus anzutake]KAF8331979.1 P-loop containing nucleoside triphosphate hydrolase protein [Cantharellus anzutake]